MKKNKFVRIAKYFLCSILVFIFFVCSYEEASASSTTPIAETKAILMVDSYSVTNEKIIPGEDFTLTIVVKNVSDKNKAEDVCINMTNPSGVAPVYGTVTQLYIGDIAPGETKEICMDYNSWTSITDDTLDFTVQLTSKASQNSVILRIPSGTDSPFSIVSVNMPNNAKVGQSPVMSFTFKVLGDDNVKDVKMIMQIDEVNSDESNIGILTPGTTKTQSLSVGFTEKGKHDIKLLLSYLDETGQTIEIPVGETEITISESTSNNDKTHETNPTYEVVKEDGDGTTNIIIMGLSGLLILAIFVTVIVVIRKNR